MPSCSSESVFEQQKKKGLTQLFRMKLSFRGKGLLSFDANAVAMEASELSLHERSTFGALAGGVAASSSSSRQLRIVGLDISYNKMHTFLGSRSLPFLEVLDASHNAFRSAMNFPVSITRLDISFNVIESLMGLDTLTQLQFLDASHNHVDSVGRLPGSLQVLNLSHNSLITTEGLGHLTKVTKLNLENNRLTTVAQTASLGSMKALRHLTIGDNPVAQNTKLILFLEAEIPKLTTLDGVPLSQAHASFTYRAQKLKQQQQANQVRARTAKMARFQADTEGRFDDVVEQELRTLNARVKELERLASGQYETEVKCRRDFAIAKQQLKRTEEVASDQEREMQQLRSEIERDESTTESLERTLESLERAFQQQHALIVMKKLER
ncbi:leucine-rich repeat protein, putative [Bodo saltans]|uniref:Leucine-rich repeat protein, putative n=1 Tax=Bodo saltans TaxID=75058 RepID=A0A0S4KH47_BODSA|nr:leucine-rich repeat protein, putative [Bodo saltans]|eukprot:CUI14445.1 leucine-rich repeat protein, putative [Bodo saltans]